MLRYKYFRFGGRHIEKPTSGYIGTIRNRAIGLLDTEMGVSRWNSVAILFVSSYITTSGLEAVIFKNRLPVISDTIRNSAVELLDPENGRMAVGTALISCLESEI